MLQLRVSRMFQRTEKSRWSSGTALSMMGVKGLWARGGGGGQGGVQFSSSGGQRTE